ncbi:hypothetical protein [Cerasicoccus arenae]|uniref:Fructose-bisphosphate aldolase n=1 Tax=Cerasicoccus arenae TaxID=424488 RepID=A0A8J3D8P0_9BACT|nr:hypothetical protein [Cerasicoccus arenae]MBK1858843.1 hypothetical protein [Cerasicoccus arenae]GHB95996.1 hypothetical protein GCM10007047_09640 [Cerasicoccus arenae]
MSIKTLDQKLKRIASGSTRFQDFIIADAKDADMAFGIMAPGPNRAGKCAHGYDRTQQCYKTLAEYQTQIRDVINQKIVDIMLLSASNLEVLGIEEGLLKNSPITPAARANDTTDVWAVRGGSYPQQPSRHFRTATIDHIKYGKLESHYGRPHLGADLGLYSVTFTNNLDWDYAALEAFHDFRIEAEKKHFRYFLEVFNPNVDPGFDPQQTGSFLNDSIIRCLAGVTKVGRPLFLKIPYNGPGPLEELVSYDSNLVVGILGGSSGTTLDAFQLIHDASKHGARVALFGRKINLSENPLIFIEMLRRVTDREFSPKDAVRYYHDVTTKAGIPLSRSLEDDLQLTDTSLSYS